MRWMLAIVVGMMGVPLAACSGDDDGGQGSPSGGGAAGAGNSGGSGNASGAGGGSAAGGGSGGSGGSAASAGSSGSGGNAGAAGAGGGSGTGLAAKYPGDVGMESDPAVVWVENFEQGSVGAVTSRYEDAKTQGMALSSDVPSGSSGQASIALTAGGSNNASDFYKRFDTGYDELFVRYYAKYQGGVEWHHTGVWVGGYNPASNWPNPQAGLKPDGDDRFSVSLEPVAKGANPRMDFYNYWMKMHSWMDSPSGNTAYYGNTLIHDPALKVDDDQWMCIEIQVKVNPNPSSPSGAELAVWKNDQLVVHFTDTSPKGYWVKDKFCPENATGTECTNYAPPSGTPMLPLDLQYRSVDALKLNYFWPQNYITSGPAGTVSYDDMVVATQRIGCLN